MEKKKDWSAPELMVYGSIAELTKQAKKAGYQDGILYDDGNSIIDIGTS